MYSFGKRKTTIFFVFLVFFFQLNQRPAILQEYGEVLFVLSFACFALVLLLKYRITVTKRKKVFLLITLFLLAYLLFQSFLAEEGHSVVVIKSSSFILLATVSALLLDHHSWKVALKAFVYPVLFFSFSYAITLIVFIIIGSLESLELMRFTVPRTVGYYDIVVYAPWSIANEYQSFIFDKVIARAVGYFREPGLFSVVVVLSYFGIDFLDLKFKRICKILVLVTLLLTLSTAGIGSFLVALVYYNFISNSKEINFRSNPFLKAILLLSFIPLFYIFIYGDFRFSLLSKFGQGSGLDRLKNLQQSIQVFQENPFFGVGYPNSEISTVTFLSTIGQIGIIGAILFLAIFLLPNIELIRRRDPRVVFMIPVLLVALFAQPLFDKALLFLILSLVVGAPLYQKRIHLGI